MVLFVGLLFFWGSRIFHGDQEKRKIDPVPGAEFVCFPKICVSHLGASRLVKAVSSNVSRKFYSFPS